MPRTTKENLDNKIKDNKEVKKSASSKVASKTAVKKKSTAVKEKTSKSKTTTKKKAATVSNKKVTAKKVQENIQPEYYDLIYRYNKTIVKILAQTPTTLFVYWDISDEDRQKYLNEYGSNFFDITKPILVVHNTTKNYTFEVEINDFANSWYFNVNDTNCDYIVELGRREKSPNSIPQLSHQDNYIQIASSNTIAAPNDHILFEKMQKLIFYKNVKTNETHSKNIVNFSFLKYIGKIHNTNDLYNRIYKDQNIVEQKNPSSNNSKLNF